MNSESLEYPVPASVKALHISETTQYDKDHFVISEKYRDKVEYVLIPDGFLINRVERLAQQIHSDYKGQELELLVIMNSAFRFFTELLKQLVKCNELNQEQVSIKMQFTKVSTYVLTQAAVEMDKIQISLTPDEVKGKNMLIVEDIFDSGSTIIKTKAALEQMGAASSKVAVLFHKRNPKNLRHCYFADYVGFTIPDKFVVGFGMDYNQHYRDLTHLCVINQAGIEAFK